MACLNCARWHLHVISFCSCAAFPSTTGGVANKYGIGVYTDTPGSPSLDVQLDAAAELVGPATATSSPGWVTLYLCAWRIGPLSCVNRTTTHDPASSHALSLAYHERSKCGCSIGKSVRSSRSQRWHHTSQLHIVSAGIRTPRFQSTRATWRYSTFR